MPNITLSVSEELKNKIDSLPEMNWSGAVREFLDEKAKDFLVEKGYQPEMGVRPLKRAIEQFLEDPLAEKLLIQPDKKVDYQISAKKDEIIFVEKEQTKPQEKKDLAKI